MEKSIFTGVWAVLDFIVNLLTAITIVTLLWQNEKVGNNISKTIVTIIFFAWTTRPLINYIETIYGNVGIRTRVSATP